LKTLRQERQKLIALIIVGVLYSFVLAYLFQSLPRVRLTSDFFPRWHASKMLLTTGRSIYDWTNATEVSAVTGWPRLNQLGYYYPAYLLLFTAPLAMMPYKVAHVIWVVFGLWCLWLGIFILARQIKPDMSLNRLTLLLALVTTAVPVFQHTLYAQFNTIAVLALALTYRALHRERYLLAGLWAGGLLFKPQAVLISLFFLLAWSALKRERWPFWVGLGLASIALWGMAELLEPNWVINFWQSLGSYVSVHSVIDIMFWNPYQVVSLSLFGLILWLMWRVREVSPREAEFYGMLALAISLNALIVPLFGMLHMVFLGPILAILLSGFEVYYPLIARWVWLGTVVLFIIGFLAFILPLLLTDSTGLQINTSESVYRFAMPILFSLIALPIIFVRSNNEIIRHHSRL
jgi:hypothetical protein